MTEKKLELQLNQLLSALSMALDLAQNRNYEHSRRTAYISLLIAKNMGLDNENQADIYYAALLHDVGMAGELSKYDINDFHYSSILKKSHSDMGAEIVRKLPFSKHVEDSILYHHDNWDGSGVNGLSKEDIPLGAHIIHAADSLDILYDRQPLTSEFRKSMIDYMVNNKRKQFHPEVVNSLVKLSETEKFWMDLQNYKIQGVLKKIEPIKYILPTIEDLEKIAEAFAILIDSKSPYTHTHSQEIAILVRAMSKRMGYDETKQRKMGISGYMHDLGKLVIPSDILKKPGKLTDSEFLLMKAHPYYTKQIIGQVKGCEDLASWAGNHHEKLSGKGYPENLDKDVITEEDQLIAVADIYHALTEDRPYRVAMKKNDALVIINNMVKNQEISGTALDCLSEVIK